MKVDIVVIAGVVVITALMGLLIMLPPGPDHKDAAENRPGKDLGAGAGQGASFYRMGLSSDKKSYRQNSEANFTISLTSPKNATGRIRLWGVKNKYGAYKIDLQDDVSLTNGSNIIRKSARLPRCSSCAGLEPGNFSVYSALYINGSEIINSSIQIEIAE